MIVVSTLQPTGHNRSQSKVLHLHTDCYMLSFWTRLLHSYPRLSRRNMSVHTRLRLHVMKDVLELTLFSRRASGEGHWAEAVRALGLHRGSSVAPCPARGGGGGGRGKV